MIFWKAAFFIIREDSWELEGFRLHSPYPLSNVGEGGVNDIRRGATWHRGQTRGIINRLGD